MTTGSLAFVDELQGANYNSISSLNFKVGIFDPDSADLTSQQLHTLEASGKSVIAYLSIGEAENYRSYWQSGWDSHPPSFIMGPNPDWAGSYRVKFWDPAWQQTVINEATSLARAGYSGVMLDVVDVYTVSAVAAADGGINHARADMIKFVEAISSATKAINPDFKIIQNNALDLLTVNPDDPSSATNTAYMSHIDGLVAEDTFYNPNNTPTSWGAWNQQYLDHAVAAGKTVLAIDYPSNAGAQQDFINQAIAHGYVPYVAKLALNNNIADINYQIPDHLPDHLLTSLLNTITGTSTSSGGTATGTNDTGSSSSSHAGSDPSPAPTSGPLADHNAVYAHNGTTTLKGTMTDMEFVFGSDYHGHATIKFYGHDVGDVIGISHDIYQTQAEALSHVTYHGKNAIIDLGSHGTIKIAAAGKNSLVASDFHII